MAEALTPSTARPRLLELRDITKEFPGVRALDGVSFDLERGEIHALCGENGAGKSTLIKILCGCFPHGSYGGEVLLEGRPVHFRNLRAAEERGIALIAQELALVPELSVAENLFLGREPSRFGLVRRDAMHEAARQALAHVGLDIDPERPIRELGIGQQQMVEIAKALAKQASILVLDEPTAALPGEDVRRLHGLLGELRAKGVSSIYISHRLEEVFQTADRITVLRDGRSVGTSPRASLSPAQVISRMVGREVKDLYPRAPRRDGAVLLAVRGWKLEDPANPGRFVLEDVGFEVHAGEVLGIAGLMGAGRTALVSSLFGTARSRVEGNISIAGAAPRVPFRSPAEAIAAGLALVGEDRKRYGLVPEASVADNLTLVTLQTFVRHGLLDTRARDRECRASAEFLRIKTPSLATRVAQLSGGTQQKVVLGRWLLARPRVLLLDEPTRGIDVGAKAEIYQLVVELAGRGLGVVLVSSDLPELLGLSHRVLVLSRGRQTALLQGDAANPEAIMAAATSKGRA
jgi:D-xylose transport system ATP-binding protein